MQPAEEPDIAHLAMIHYMGYLLTRLALPAVGLGLCSTADEPDIAHLVMITTSSSSSSSPPPLS